MLHTGTNTTHHHSKPRPIFDNRLPTPFLHLPLLKMCYTKKQYIIAEIGFFFFFAVSGAMLVIAIALLSCIGHIVTDWWYEIGSTQDIVVAPVQGRLGWILLPPAPFWMIPITVLVSRYVGKHGWPALEAFCDPDGELAGKTTFMPRRLWYWWVIGFVICILSIIVIFGSWTRFSPRAIFIRHDGFSAIEVKHYNNIDTIYQVTYTTNESRKLQYSPHVVIQFDDGSSWNSRMDMYHANPIVDAHILELIHSKTGLVPKIMQTYSPHSIG